MAATKELDLYKALASQPRLQVFELLCGGPSHVEEIADKLGIRSITARHHLKALESVGLIEGYEIRGKVGKPRIYYRVARNPPMITFPKRQYLQLTKSVLESLRAELSEDRFKEFLQRVGRNISVSILSGLKERHPSKSMDFQFFRENFPFDRITEMVGDIELVESSPTKMVYRLYNCPYLELACKMPDVFGMLEDGFEAGVAEAFGPAVGFKRLKCMAHGDPYCEFVYEEK